MKDLSNYIDFKSTEIVEYTDKHCSVVEEGFNAITHFYEAANKQNKRSLLLCLDQYLDPYYEHNLSDSKEIFSWLKILNEQTIDEDISEDIIELLQLNKKRWWQFWL